MPDFNEQLNIIARLREEWRRSDENFYRARLRLDQSQRSLNRAKQEQTIPDANRDRAIASLRSRIAPLETRLGTLRGRARELQEWFNQLAKQEQAAEHEKSNLTALENRRSTLLPLLTELEQEDPQLKAELRRLDAVRDDLTRSIAKAEETLAQLRQREEEQRRAQAAVDSETDGVLRDLRGLQQQLAERLRATFPDREAIEGERQELESTVERLNRDASAAHSKLTAAIAELYREDSHPRRGLARLDDAIPFLLFPVRLETIFVPISSVEGTVRTELWVRVYPDDIAIHTHEKDLTNSEVVAGELYWTELLSAEHLIAEKDHRRRAAWRHIVEIFGGQRASWVARQMKPTDWDSLAAAGSTQTLIEFLLLADANFFTNLRALPMSSTTRTALDQAIAANDGDAFSCLAEKKKWFDRINTAVRTQITGFPAHDLTKTDGWTRAPRTYVMPDRFVLLLYPTETAAPREIPGAPIPDTLYLGPEPLDANAGFKTVDDVLTFGGAFDWMANFDEAVEQGMGFKVLLTEQEARNGFARVLVLGVQLSADANGGAALVEELVDNHQYSPKGFSIVAQGTPTNNTERNGTGYSDNDPYNDLAFFTYVGPPAFDPVDPDPRKSQTDGRLLADALGIRYAPLQTVQGANQTDIIEARAMNTALFPSTLGYWLHVWMAPVVTPEAARQTRTFFTQFVSGRGPLPAIRVGNQPYGILLTSDFSRWKYPDSTVPIGLLPTFSDEIRYLNKLRQLLAELQKIWTGIAATLPWIGKPGADGAQTLMNILGLHPASVEFFQRIGYSDEYLRNLDSFKDGGRYANELASLMFSMPPTARLYLRNLGFEETIPTVGAMRSLHVLWQHYVTSLDAPNLVENKPPSETSLLAVNYIDWFAKAEGVNPISSGNPDAPPQSALLYLMLRNALLLQMHHGAYEWLVERTVFEPALEQALRPTTLPGVRASQVALSKFELMETRVQAAEPSHPSPATMVADWIWAGPDPAEIEAAFLREQKAALPILAATPTARLERCFVEHLDCCNYRLDAWQTGLFNQRLQSQRRSGGREGERRMGIYLGAFGWVEDLKPVQKTFINPETLPPLLRPADSNPVIEEDAVPGPVSSSGGSRQGGFVHAPSLNHAAAAALLRNAYLSHATPETAEMFSVNLSSERVRRAEFLLEGMRNGQPIDALLGYQFERGLHDRTSESAARGDVPVLELNQFIQPYRKAFPFEAREIAQAGTGGPAETVPAYSVINGLRLAQATLSSANGFGLSAVLSAAELPNANQGAAILAERDALLDSIDAVNDLLMAENAYQLVRGNFDRVAAVSLAQKDAHLPPELEVINTPRGSEFTFTNRVTLHFDDLSPTDASSNPWPGRPMTPRAVAEAGMNHWLGSVLSPFPEKVLCAVYWVEPESETRHDEHPVTLADLDLQPVDFVWLVQIGSGDAGGATELETRIASEYRRSHGIGDDKTVRIDFNPTVSAGETTFGRVFPLARRLRALLAESRALHAEDFLPAAGGKESAIPVDKDNPKGYQVSELQVRVALALNRLTALADSIDGASAPTVGLVFLHDPSTPADDEVFSGSLGAAFTKLESEKLHFTDSAQVTVTFLHADAETLRDNLRAIADFGIGDAYPAETDLTTDAAKASLLDRAHRVARRLRRNDPKDGVLDRAADLISKATPDKPKEEQATYLLQTGKILFGDNFNFLPKFICHNEIDIATADGARSQLLQHAVNATPGITGVEVVEEWLEGLARVRPRLHQWEVVRTLADALNDIRLELRPVQVPYRTNDSWLAVAFPEKDADGEPFGISRDTLSIAAHGASAFQAGVLQSGVLLDDWTEEIPTAQEITGIAFRFNQPNASPPQTLLLAVTPEETGAWNWDALVGTLNDTLARAKRRAVEPEQLEKQGLVWNAFAPALVSEFSTLAAADVSLDQMLMMDYVPLTQFYLAQAKRS
jgi:hypothetical protein